jgi:hypothetical protein
LGVLDFGHQDIAVVRTADLTELLEQFTGIAVSAFVNTGYYIPVARVAPPP